MTGTGRRWVLVIGALALHFGVPSGRAQAEDMIRDPGYFVRTWLWTDPDAGGSPLTTIDLTFGYVQGSRGGGYRGGPLPPDLGGPNGLGANSWEFTDGTLAFLFKDPARSRVDVMLRGQVTAINANAFQFRVTDGFYGVRLRGKVFVFRIP